MNENLFTFPGGTAEESGDNPFDLRGFTELTGNDTQNPFADLLAGGEAAEGRGEMGQCQAVRDRHGAD